MKKYKIVTDGKAFRVKVKDFLFWYFASEMIHPDLPDEPLKFKTHKQAEKQIKKWENIDIKKKRKWESL